MGVPWEAGTGSLPGIGKKQQKPLIDVPDLSRMYLPMLIFDGTQRLLAAVTAKPSHRKPTLCEGHCPARRTRRLAGSIVTILLAAASMALAQTTNPPGLKLLAFAGTNHVRIQVHFPPVENIAPLTIDGTIMHTASGETLWRGSLGQVEPRRNAGALLETTVDRLVARLWEPLSPHLYSLDITIRQQDHVLSRASTRFGFRSMTIINGQLHLNGRPVFLRGTAINPPGRTIPEEVGASREFAEDYVRFLKSQNVNIFRISTDSSQTWFDVCDELGMMLYAGRYGFPPGVDEKKRPPADAEASIAGYRELFESCVNHPSIVIYCLANELPVSGRHGEAFSAFLTKAHESLRAWDPTRVFIANAGYGEGREGDICDVHRYWGWYYNSFLTYYNLRDALRKEPLFGPGKNQPLTFSECVGSFTGSSGEFNLVRSKQLGARLGWIGGAENPVEDSLAYQSMMVKEATESFRRMRPLNHRLAGIMPFTILFYNWSGIQSFEEMIPKPAMRQLAVSYQPILSSWELWTRQVYAGARIHPVVHIVNDSDDGRALTNAVLRYSLADIAGRKLLQGELPVPRLPYFGVWSQRLDLTMPPDLLTGEYRLSSTVECENLAVSSNGMDIFIAERAWGRPPLKLSSTAHIYDKSGRTATALAASGINTTPLKEIDSSLKKVRTLIIGENAWDSHLTRNRGALREFVQSGGRIVCLQQRNPGFPLDWLPARIEMLESSANDTPYPPATRPHREQSHVNMQRPAHPVFMGLDRKRLALWSDDTNWQQEMPGFPRVYPVTSGFRLTNPDDLARTAVLANYDRGLEGVALCEMFDGQGSVLLSALDMVSRSGIDPAADRFLANIVFYATDDPGHDPLVTPNRPIVWGDLPSEQGLVCGPLNGLIINAEWLRGTTQAGMPSLPANSGSWNMMPGDQFVPRGRNPFGQYSYSTGTMLRRGDSKEQIGQGFFHARTPEGATRLATIARNPGKQPAAFRITLNTQSFETLIPPGEQTTTLMDLPRETALKVTFTGPKDLVLIRTAFE